MTSRLEREAMRHSGAAAVRCYHREPVSLKRCEKSATRRMIDNHGQVVAFYCDEHGPKHLDGWRLEPVEDSHGRTG